MHPLFGYFGLNDQILHKAILGEQQSVRSVCPCAGHPSIASRSSSFCNAADWDSERLWPNTTQSARDRLDNMFC